MAGLAVDVFGGFEVANPLEDPGWDRKMAAHPEATVFHSAGWAGVLADTYGFRPTYLTRMREGHRPTLLALMEIRGILGRRRGVSLPFTDNCPILLPEGEDETGLVDRFLKPGDTASCLATLDPLLEAARALARQRSWQNIEFRPKPPAASVGSGSIVFASHEVPLLGSDAEQERQCEPAMRRSLRQAQTAALPVRIGGELSLVQAYYRLHCLTRRRQGAPPQPWRFFANLHKMLISQGLGFVVVVGDSPIAGAVFLRFGTRAVYKFGASDGRLLETRPNQRVMWAGLRHAAGLGGQWMDLGRTSIANEGLRRFKRGWGSVETRLMYHQIDLKRNRQNVMSDHTRGLQAVFLKLLPVCLTRWVGELAYRFAA